MFRIRGDWDHDAAAEFLTEATVPVRLSCHTPDGNLWMLSLWYEYDPGEGSFRCATAASADVVRYLRADDTVAFEISTNEVPYRGVRGQGTASIAPDENKTVLRRLLERYLGGTDSSLAKTLLSPDREEVCITVDIDRAYTWDFSDRMGDAGD
ncbi:pyridoxamine 5'-phosphate oxidase family protein [Haloarchaeobius amylolyticus]|uniref:pyridoxamine 5'-phosphate oxidase family protein n=1 Tax=Haloarchaeobius amylolyticus TaxID=1198296 RepID=UPI0022710D38|nr:pyridoxamine 5'-phosphate oxidase family protein [Haloarchaeobius amylolyticus]